MGLENIGMLVHSLGGRVTLKTSKDNNRIKVALQLNALRSAILERGYLRGLEGFILFISSLP